MLAPPADWETLVRRCADGELAPADRPALRAALEAHPAAYEPLALALLERQALTDALRVAEAAPGSVTVARPPAPWRRAAGLLAAAAAGLASGVFVFPRDSPRETTPPLVLADAAPVLAEEPAAAPPAAPVPVAAVSWPTASGDPVTLPVYDGRDVPAGFGASPISDADRAALIAAGRYAGEWRQEYTLPLDDGRLLTIPVHAVGVRGPEVF